MGIECRTFISKLSELLTIKGDLPKSTVPSWVRTKISLALIRFTFDQKQYDGNERYLCARKPNQKLK